MQFQVTKFENKQQLSSESITCISWITNDEFYACGDGHELLKWDAQGKDVVKVADLPKDIFPTSLQSLQKSRSNKPGSDSLLLITSTNGKIIMVSAMGRLEKSVDAHKSDILVSKISKDGSSIMTGADDGSVKIWSRSVMLRASFSETNPTAVIAADWSPDSQAVAYTQGPFVVVKPLIPGIAQTKWQAHDALILSLSWSPTQNGFIATGAEDGKCKVWDAAGHIMFSSSNQGSPVSCLSWNLNGQILAVGAHNSLRLCQNFGRFSPLEMVPKRTAHSMAWNKDNTRLVGACGSGKIISASVVGREIQNDGIQAKMMGNRSVRMRDLKISDMWETLETKGPILLMEGGHGHVVLATSDRCLIYNMTTINTPLEVKVSGVFLLQITSKCILAVNEFGFWVYSLQGRAVTVPQVPNILSVNLTEHVIHLAPDHLAIRDSTEQRVVHVLDFGYTRTQEGQSPPKLRFKEPIKQLALNQTESERCLAAIDSQGDLYIVPNPALSNSQIYKIGGMVRHIKWNCSNPYLSALTESELVVWFYPQIVALDNQLLPNTRIEKDLSEIGMNGILAQFSGGILEVQRHDKMLICIPVNTVPAAIFHLTEKGDWAKAMKLVRKTSSTSLCKPGSLHSLYAARCWIKNQPKSSLSSYTALGLVDEVEYILSRKKAMAH